MMTRAEILPQILRMKAGDQLLIAEAIHDHLAKRDEVSEDELKAELLRLQTEADANPGSLAPLAEVMHRLETRR